MGLVQLGLDHYQFLSLIEPQGLELLEDLDQLESLLHFQLHRQWLEELE
jgi:hypothetical protein